MQPSAQQAATTNEAALVASILALPPALANRIAATAVSFKYNQATARRPLLAAHAI